MLNLVMTVSPRYAAMAMGRKPREEAAKDHESRHRRAWYRKDRAAEAPLASHSVERALRERTA